MRETNWETTCRRCACAEYDENGRNKCYYDKADGFGGCYYYVSKSVFEKKEGKENDND